MQTTSEMSLTELEYETEQYLQEVQKAQQSLLSLQTEKQTALIRSDWGRVQILEQQEQPGQQKLRTLIQQRSQLLLKCREHQLSGSNLQEVCRNWGWKQDPAKWSLLTEVRNDAERLRQQGWSLWVMSQRAARFYSQLLEAISQGGKKSPCYQQNADWSGGGEGGSLLDASI